MDLPFEDCSFDAATMGYGLRNVASIPAALRVGGWWVGEMVMMCTAIGLVLPLSIKSAAVNPLALLRWKPHDWRSEALHRPNHPPPVCPQELHRVLRPGCSVAILDFNNAADNPVVDATQVGRECLRCAVHVAREDRAPACLMLHNATPLHSIALMPPFSPPPPPWLQAFFLDSLVVPRARQLGVAEEYE